MHERKKKLYQMWNYTIEHNPLDIHIWNTTEKKVFKMKENAMANYTRLN
jgi:hypothetical protein